MNFHTFYTCSPQKSNHCSALVHVVSRVAMLAPLMVKHNWGEEDQISYYNIRSCMHIHEWCQSQKKTMTTFWIHLTESFLFICLSTIHFSKYSVNLLFPFPQFTSSCILNISSPKLCYMSYLPPSKPNAVQHNYLDFCALAMLWVWIAQSSKWLAVGWMAEIWFWTQICVFAATSSQALGQNHSFSYSTGEGFSPAKSSRSMKLHLVPSLRMRGR
jgi:hypothetical protein